MTVQVHTTAELWRTHTKNDGNDIQLPLEINEHAHPTQGQALAHGVRCIGCLQTVQLDTLSNRLLQIASHNHCPPLHFMILVVLDASFTGDNTIAARKAITACLLSQVVAPCTCCTRHSVFLPRTYYWHRSGAACTAVFLSFKAGEFIFVCQWATSAYYVCQSDNVAAAAAGPALILLIILTCPHVPRPHHTVTYTYCQPEPSIGASCTLRLCLLLRLLAVAQKEWVTGEEEGQGTGSLRPEKCNAQ
eukprot:585333-Rhodomonas_salina.1